MLERVSTDLDLRSKRIVITEKYAGKMELLEELINKFQDSLLEGVTDSELNTFFSVIDKMKENLEK